MFINFGMKRNRTFALEHGCFLWFAVYDANIACNIGHEFNFQMFNPVNFVRDKTTVVGVEHREIALLYQKLEV